MNPKTKVTARRPNIIFFVHDGGVLSQVPGEVRLRQVLLELPQPDLTQDQQSKKNSKIINFCNPHTVLPYYLSRNVSNLILL